MKAILNKRFDDTIWVVNQLWQRRNRIRKAVLERVYAPDGEIADILDCDLRDAVLSAMKRLPIIKTKKEFIYEILSAPCFNFFDMFVKRIIP